MDDLRYQVDMLKAMVNTYESNENIYKQILDWSHRAFIYIQKSSKVIKTFGKWEDFFDFSINELSDFNKIIECFNAEDREGLRLFLLPDVFNTVENKIITKTVDNNKIIEIHRIELVNDETDKTDFLFSFADITEMHNMKEELSFLAYYDFVTGLYNRNFYIQKLTQLINEAKKNNALVSIILLDIDDFHKINDSMGIVVGDEVIQNFGFYLKEFCNDNIIGARFDGDIYALAIYDAQGTSKANTIYNIIRDRLKYPFILTDGSEVSFTVSAGVSEYPEAGDNVLELVNGAEIVMLEAKKYGKNEIRYYDTQILNEFMNSVLLENKLKAAIKGMEFYLNFQPQYYSDTNKLRGFEALIRWKDSEGNYIPPSTFIPMAEKNGAIIQIGDWVVENSIKTFMEWKKKFDMDIVLSINISSLQYKRPDFVNKLISTANKYEMLPEELELEITESLLIEDINVVFEKMVELRDFGVRISIDDFGTGYSALSYLNHLPADVVKIDKSFIDKINKDNATNIIIDTIINLARKLGFLTIAEGVEEVNQLNFLKEIGCDAIQGYYLGKPLSVSEIDELLLRLI